MSIKELLPVGALLVTGCALEEYSALVTVVRDGGDQASTAGDTAGNDPGPGDSNQGDSNQGDSNQGDFNQGDFNQGDFNQGDFNQGDFNQGDFNQGDFNQGDFNQGDFNQGDFNQGDFNQGDFSQGDPGLPPQSIQLGPDPVAGGNVVLFEVTPDSTKVVYLADEEVDDRYELYVVNIDGSGHTKLSGALANNRDVVAFAIAPDSQKVVYRADQRVDDGFELWASNINGTGNAKLHPDHGVNNIIYTWAVSGDSTRVIYLCDQETNDLFEVWSTLLDGTDNLRLNDPLGVNRDVTKFVLSPDGSLVVYRADVTTDNVFELWAVTPDRTDHRRVHEALTGGIDAGSTFIVAPDNGTVAFQGDLETNNVTEVFAAEIPSTAVKLNGPLGATNEIGTRELHYLPNSIRVIYRADQDIDEVWELYSVRDNGLNRFKLHPSLSAGHAAGSVALTLDSTKVIYTADADQLAVFELYAINNSGTGRAKLNSVFALGKNVVRFAATPDSSRAVYIANQANLNALDIYSVSLDGTGRRGISGFGADANVYNFRIAPDSSRVLFTADGDLDGVIELYSVAMDSSGLVRLNDGLAPGSDVADFRVTNSHAIYLSDMESPGTRKLFAKADITTPGSGTSQAGGPTTLVDTGLVARYFLDEADGGSVPDSATDAAPSPLNLPITKNPNMSYIVGPGGRGLQWQRVDGPGTPVVAIDGTKLHSRLQGSTAGTIEVIVDLDHGSSSEPRLVYFGGGTSDRSFSVGYDSQKKHVKFWFDYLVSKDARWWDLDLINAGRHMITVVLDTTQADPLSRVKLYYDGVLLPGYSETANSPPAQNATLDFYTGYEFFIGNRAGGERSNDGRTYYTGIYDIALNAAQVYQNVQVLLHDDDAP